MSTPSTPIDPSPPPSAGGQKKRGLPAISKLSLPPEAEQWLSTEFARNPKPTGEDTARWLLQLQRWTPEYTMPHLTSWIKGKRQSATRLRNNAEKQRLVAEAQMESQVFPNMTDTMKTALRGFYAIEEQPAQPLIESWAAALGIGHTEVSRWIKWKRAMDETMRGKPPNTSIASTSKSTVASGSSKSGVVATPPRAHHAAPASGHAQHAGAGSSLTGGPHTTQHGPLPRPQHQVALPYKVKPHAQPPPPPHGMQAYQAYPVPYPPNATFSHPRSATGSKSSAGFVTGHPGAVPTQYTPTRAPAGPIPLPPRPPDASRRQPSVPPIAVLERGTPQSSSTFAAEASPPESRRSRHVPPISTGSAFPSPTRPKFLFPHHPRSPEELKPDVSLLSRPSTAPTHERRRSHSPARLSPTHRRDERPPRRQSPPPSSTSSPGHIFRYSPGAGSPSASTSAPSLAAGRPPGESEPPPSPSPPPTGARGGARYSPAVSEASTSRTVTSGPLAPFFTELASALHKAGMDNTAYPFDTSDLSISVSGRARRLSTDGILRQLPRSTQDDVAPTPVPSSAPALSRYNDWLSSFSKGEKKVSASERFNAEVEARNAEMLRDIQSGAFAHLGLDVMNAPSRGHTPVVKREPEI